MDRFKQLVLIVLDGFGVASPFEGNAVVAANPRNLNYIVNHFPATTLQASGPAVGLPWGERGNSETGHLNLGTGRIMSQDLPRINRTISTGEFFQNPAFLQAFEHVKKNDSKLHLVGLLSSGGVHSSEEHLHSLLALAAEHALNKVFVHAFTDGRDSPQKAALPSLGKLARKFQELKLGKIATLTGRFYAMDRGRHFEVTEATYRALVEGEGEKTESPRDAVESYYQKQIYDETIPPTVVATAEGPVGRIASGDAVIFFNFRPDRMVQLFRAFTDPNFAEFSKKYERLQNVCYVTMTLYEKDQPAAAAFPPAKVRNVLSEVISSHNLSQFHIAESEKYAHVTSFFNGGREAPWPLEEREIVVSPASYQQRYADVPEMSADKIGRRAAEKLKAGVNFILVNFANPDMVGHTGQKAACVQAILAVDRNLGTIFEAAMALRACMVVTADHGNIEQIIDLRTGTVDKEHSLNPVPLLVAGGGLERKEIKTRGYLELPPLMPEGVLSDVSPTVLDLMGIEKPSEMTAISLLPVLLEQIK